MGRNVTPGYILYQPPLLEAISNGGVPVQPDILQSETRIHNVFVRNFASARRMSVTKMMQSPEADDLTRQCREAEIMKIEHEIGMTLEALTQVELDKYNRRIRQPAS